MRNLVKILISVVFCLSTWYLAGCLTDAPSNAPAASAPTGLKAIAGDGRVTLTWDVPIGHEVIGYNPAQLTNKQRAFVTNDASKSCTVGGSPASSCVITGLTNGVTYQFAVVAFNQSAYYQNCSNALEGSGEQVGGQSCPSNIAAATPMAGLGDSVPGAPTSVTGIAGNAQATVSWTAPDSTGGTPITGYKAVAVSDTTKSCTTTGAVTCTVTGLTNGTSYTFTVKARNIVGSSAASSPSAAVTPSILPSIPGAPTGVTAVAGNAQAVVTWIAPSSSGSSAITGYKATAVSDTTKSCTTTGTLTCTVTGLINGTSYTFTVKAQNIVGSSAASPASSGVTPLAPPGSPSGASAVSGDARATVSWTAATANGSAITGYTVTSNPEGKTCSTTGTLTCVDSNLTNGTSYTFTVVATSAAGNSSASAASSAITPLGAPGVPIAVSATAGTQVSVSWTAPVSNGGSAITGYTVSSSPGNATCTTTSATNCTITGLTNGTAYTFTVKATNSTGTSAASTASASVTPNATAPGSPTNVIGTAANGQVSVSWTAPISTGGSAITGYTATASPGSATCTTTGSTSCILSGLTNGTAYTFTVKASNAVGTSVASAVSAAVTPATIPGVPKNISGVAGNGQITVSWAQPDSDGGSVITSYTATAVPGNATCSTSSLGVVNCTITGLTNGTAYTLSVKATNAVGAGPVGSASGTVIPVYVIPFTLRATSTGDFIRGVTWNGTQYLAVGYKSTFQGIAATSTDGITWTSRSLGKAALLWSVAWTGNLYVAVGYDNTSKGMIETSPDGITWTSRASGSLNALSSVVWSGPSTGTGSGKLVAVGNGGAILTSIDGVNWTPQTSGITSGIASVAWSGTQFVAVGAGGAILTSTDGITWTARTSGTTANLASIGWNGSQWITVGENAAILTSTDGVTWIKRSVATTFSFTSVVSTNSQILALTAGSSNVYFSSSGTTWTPQTSATSESLYGGYWRNNGTVDGQLIVVGSNGAIMTSP